MVLVTIVAAVVTALLLALFVLARQRRQRRAGPGKAPACGALDPVDDPAYNMREVIKQTLLLEQHVAERRKGCRACMVKHLALCCALLEEAAWMAGGRASEYPLLLDGVELYGRLLDTWPWRRPGDVPEETRAAVLEELRQRRRALVEAYMLGPGVSACGHDDAMETAA